MTTVDVWRQLSAAVVAFLAVPVVICSTVTSTVPPVPGAGQQQLHSDGERDFCLHESFNATCRHGSVLLMTSAAYGRMRLGRCINGDFNIGCSKDVTAYMDAQCSTRSSCDVSVRNLVDIHPCQRDFMSYLEATYRCVEVTGAGLPVCPREARLAVHVTASGGYLSNAVGPYRWHVGTEACPWTLAARPGQKIYMRSIVLHMDTTPPVKTDEPVACSAIFVVKDNHSGTKELPVCSNSASSGVGAASKARERHLYTSVGNEVTLYVSRGLGGDHRLSMDKEPYPRVLISYEVIGCPDIHVPPNAWLQRAGDNVIIKCNDTMETWYLSCQRNQWKGDIGNCSRKIHLVKNETEKDDTTFPTNGIILAVLIGILLGIFIGMVLLLTVHCVRHRSRRRLKKRAAMFMASRGTPDSLNSGEPTFRRCGSRLRGSVHGAGGACGSSEADHYPALLGQTDKSSVMTMLTTSTGGTGSGGDLEKLYDFTGNSSTVAASGGNSTLHRAGGGSAVHRYYCPSTNNSGSVTAMLDYTSATEHRNNTLNNGNDICRTAFDMDSTLTFQCQRPLDVVTASAAAAVTSSSSAAAVGCPLCVVHECQCGLNGSDSGWMTSQYHHPQSTASASAVASTTVYDVRRPVQTAQWTGSGSHRSVASRPRHLSGTNNEHYQQQQHLSTFKVKPPQQQQQQHEMNYYPAGLRSPAATGGALGGDFSGIPGRPDVGVVGDGTDSSPAASAASSTTTATAAVTVQLTSFSLS